MIKAHVNSARWTILVLISALGFCFVNAQEKVGENEAPIAVEKATDDDAIARRISEIYGAVGGFERVEIAVESGVVKLTGTISDDGSREDAVSLASRMDGVVLVIDRMEEPAEITSQLAPAYEKLQDMGRTFVIKLPLIATALLVFFGGFFLSHLVKKRSAWLDRFNLSALGKLLTVRLIRLGIVLGAVLIALELLDATAIVGAVVGAAGLAGLALGFAFQNIVENYLAGVLLSTRNPFEIGDAVEIDGNKGKVALLTARDTVLITFDGNHLRIPNAVVMNSVLLNLTRNPLRRFDFYVGVSTDFDLSEVKRIAMENLRENPAVLTDPAPMVLIDNLGDSAVVVRMFGWVNQNHHDFLKSKSESIRLIKEAFDEAGIEMPEPIYRVHLKEGKPPVENGDTAKPSPRREKKSVEQDDIAPDNAITDQIKAAPSELNEENFLKEENRNID